MLAKKLLQSMELSDKTFASFQDVIIKGDKKKT